MQRNRAQFFGNPAPLREDELERALWHLYWRGTAAVRGRVEAELDPQEARQQRYAEVEAVDPQRTRWRFAFRRLVENSC
ncbi:MAG: hypothetical protein ACRDNS_09445 [Trebonia sp.]